MKKSELRPVLILFTILISLAFAHNVEGQKASDPPFKVKLDFNRWHDHDELVSDMLRLENAFPKFLECASIGKSHKGRDLMLMIINNPVTGPEMEKPAMFIDANIHGNEIQGSEVCLYTIWYLMENYGRIDKITRLVDERVFYILPCENPDGRQYFMESSGRSARSGHVPVDSDNDGLYDEDDSDDLNGNGVIEEIRKFTPGKGTHRISHIDKRIMERVPPGESGDWVLLGYEGIDNDGDGQVNEDGPGGYDPNRNWGADWQPPYIQGGAMDYPFQLPETRAVSEFLMNHPNIAGLQTYHNTGGMILRGPCTETYGEYSSSDRRFYDELGKQGERMLPFYQYFPIWSDLYIVYGGEVDWGNDSLGIISFSNELWSRGQYFTSPELKQQQEEDSSSPISDRQRSRYYFDDHLEFGDQYVEWAPFDHPQYGKVEMGGWKKFFGRLPPRFMNEELCHRNMAFTLYQADQMPQMAFGETSVDKISRGVFKIRVDIQNKKVAPTITARAAENKVVTPDLLKFRGKGFEIISVGLVADKFRPGPTELIDQNDLARIMIRNGHPGKTTRTVEYLVKGTGTIHLTYASAKGGTVTTQIKVQP